MHGRPSPRLWKANGELLCGECSRPLFVVDTEEATHRLFECVPVSTRSDRSTRLVVARLPVATLPADPIPPPDDPPTVDKP